MSALAEGPSGVHGRDHVPSARVKGGATGSSHGGKETAARASLRGLLLAMTERDQPKRPSAIESARVLNSIFDGLGGDPRTDMTSEEYDDVEKIEERVKAVLRARKEH